MLAHENKQEKNSAEFTLFYIFISSSSSSLSCVLISNFVLFYSFIILCCRFILLFLHPSMLPSTACLSAFLCAKLNTDWEREKRVSVGVDFRLLDLFVPNFYAQNVHMYYSIKCDSFFVRFAARTIDKWCSIHQSEYHQRAHWMINVWYRIFLGHPRWRWWKSFIAFKISILKKKIKDLNARTD